MLNDYPDRSRAPRPETWTIFRGKSPHAIFIPFLYSEWLTQWAVYFLSRWSLLEVLSYVGNFSVLIAVIFYFAEAGDRLQAKHYQAWQVINTAQGKGGSGGRLDALEQLNEDQVPLVGVDVADAFLQHINLKNADLRRSNFSGADLLGSTLPGTDFTDAKLMAANFRQADLTNANLTDAALTDSDLHTANLTNVNLSAAHLDNADLRAADLNNAINWTQCTITGANLYGIKNAPAGFVDWAVKHGAVSAIGDDAASQPSQ